MNYVVIIRTIQGRMIDQHRCATPMDGLSWLTSRFRANQGFGDAAIARCWRTDELNTPRQWELKIA